MASTQRAAHLQGMSTHTQNRQPSGVPIGGQFAAEHRDSAQVDLAPTVVDVQVGDATNLPGDGQVVGEYWVSRDEEGYAAWARILPVTASYLLGAEGVDEDTFDQVMSGPRWREMSRFLEQRYPGTQIADDGTEGDEIAFEVSTSFDEAPTWEQAVDVIWPTAARIANETDRGTFNSPFVGTDLVKHLDDHAFVESYPIYSGGRWWPTQPMTHEDAEAEARALEGNQQTISDEAAQALSKTLSDAYFDSAYFRLRHMGRARRDELQEAVSQVQPEHQTAARALATWSAGQPTTSDLLVSSPSTV